MAYSSAAISLALSFLFQFLLPAFGGEALEAEVTNVFDLPLEDLMKIKVIKVYAASKFDQKTTEAPSSVTVISSDEIKRYGHRTLADVLESVQGFHVSNDRNYSFLGIRGINLGDFNSRILLLVDGHRVNNNLTDGAAIEGAAFLDVDLIDRLEIIRGPGSALYGNNAFFGVLNIITRRGAQVNGPEVSVEYGAFDSYKGRVTFGKQFTNGLQMLLSGSLSESEGQESLFYKEFNTPSKNNGIAKNLDHDSSGNFFGSFSFRDFTLEGGYLRREKANPTAQFFTTFNDPRLTSVDERSYADLSYNHSFPDIVDVTAHVYGDRNEFKIGYPFVFPVGTNTQDFSSVEKDSGAWWGAELLLNKRLWDRHLVSLGLEYRDDFRQERRISGQPDVEAHRQSHGVYVQGDFAVLTNLHCDAGLRYDQVGSADPAFNPRLALIYSPIPQSTFKALYSTAFRAPNFLEMSNPEFGDIRPEEITAYELIWEQQLTGNLRSSVSGFYNQLRDLIVFDSGSFRNFDADARGIELALDANWDKGVRGRLSYTLQTTKSYSVGWDLPDSPNHLLKLNVSVPLYQDKVYAGLEYQFTSDRRSLNSTTNSFGNPLTIQGETAGSYGVVNFTLFSQNLVKNLEFSASIYNLLDQRYSDPATRFHQQDLLMRDGRSFRLKLTYRL